MAQRDDILVRWDLDPRLVTVVAPSVEITIQDLHDTLREHEQRIHNLVYPSIISTAGKEDLGGGVSVGLTSTLQNAQISFQSRYTRVADGYASTTEVVGALILTDSSADFVSSGVLRGATITNFDDQSYATVVRIISSTQLEHEPLTDGINNHWSIGDYYKIHNEIQAEISGGNLVAVDGYGDPVDPVSPSAFVQVVRTSSSSATDRNSQDIEYSSFDGAVHIDMFSSNSGTAFPNGTPRAPVNNLIDALEIANFRGFRIIRLYNDIIINSGLDYTGMSFVGSGVSATNVEIETNANVSECQFSLVTISGVLDGYVYINNCAITNLIYVDGVIKDSSLSGTITLSGSHQASLINCWDDTPGFATATIDCGGSGTSLIVRGWYGGLLIKNKTGSEELSIDLASGRLILDSTIGGTGDIIVRGIGHVTNNGTAPVDSSNVVNPGTVSTATLAKMIPFLPE